MMEKNQREVTILIRNGETEREYTIHVDKDRSLLDALEIIRSDKDPTLRYRHSCHHASCGTCACRVNGKERLACTSIIADLIAEADGAPILVEPLRGFPVLQDTLVDLSLFYRDIASEWTYIRESEELPDSSSKEAKKEVSYRRLENCIECGACVSACPVDEEFKGPAYCAALYREIENIPGKEKELLKAAEEKDGVWGCRRAVECSRVCPSGVNPARKIQELKNRLR